MTTRPDESPSDDIRLRYAAERAQRQLTLDAIRADLAAQPSPRGVRSSGRRWCAAITAMADDIAEQLHKAA